MVLHKIVKTKAYHRRLQVKYRRRREGKTDYGARKALILQDQRTINTPKHRLVVRRSNRDVICQIVMAHINGDTVMCSAYSHELPRYGIKVGLTNYAACYATGLLLARRLLKKLKLDTIFQGVKDATGADKPLPEVEKGPRPFKAILDVGLYRTSTGSRVFAAMKGACDGGLNIPHNDKRLVGYNPKTKKLDAAVLRDHIFGVHVAKYMKTLKEENEALYKKHFARYLKEGVTEDKIEGMYRAAHKAIRADPELKKTEKKKPEKGKMGRFGLKGHTPKMPLRQRQERRKHKMEQIKKKSKSFKKAILSM